MQIKIHVNSMLSPQQFLLKGSREKVNMKDLIMTVEKATTDPSRHDRGGSIQ